MFNDTVRVGGDLVYLHQHWGSEFVMNDYISKAHNVNFHVSFTPSDRVRLKGMLNYNMAEAALDPVVMPDISALLDDYKGHQDFTFPEMHTYSDIDYAMLRFSAGVEYLLKPGFVITVDGDYADLTDDSGGYVYGVESGSYVMLRWGVRIDF